jgi:beta-lactamase class A
MRRSIWFIFFALALSSLFIGELVITSSQEAQAAPWRRRKRFVHKKKLPRKKHSRRLAARHQTHENKRFLDASPYTASSKNKKAKRWKKKKISRWKRPKNARYAARRKRMTRRQRMSRRRQLTGEELVYPPHGQRTAACASLLKREVALRFLAPQHSLERSMRNYIHQLQRCGWLKAHEQARVLVYDHRNCKLVAIGQNQSTSAASLIKPFVMFAAYEKAHRQGIAPHRFPARLQEQILRMMRVSSNSATNAMIRYVGDGDAQRGFARINALLKQHHMHQTRLVELIPRNGRTYRNSTTAKDLNTLLSLIYQRRAVSPSYAKLMIDVMLHSRDSRGRTPYLRENFQVAAATKTGYTRRTNGVAGIILEGQGLQRAAYNFVAILTRPLDNSNEWEWKRISTPIVQRLSEMTYRHYLQGIAHKIARKLGGKRPSLLCNR